ncbi:MAG: hypothetical protein JWP03_1216 [Phycisphaerales bacterium]|jgi:hypothetical protein|nr:hypothetical protein [Phycisphaerales bacterium]
MRSNIKAGGIVALVAVGLLAQRAQAVITQLTSPAQVVGPSTTINFDDVTGYQPDSSYYTANTRYQPLGATFSLDTPGDIAIYPLPSFALSSPNVLAAVSGPNVTFGNAINLTLSSPVTEVGAFFGNDQDPAVFSSETLQIFDASNNLLGSVTVATNNNAIVDQFIGLSSSVPFVRARFQNDPAGEQALSTILDDVVFDTVPEPSSMAFLGLASIGLLARRRTRTAGRALDA